jgi:hypothetical protein
MASGKFEEIPLEIHQQVIKTNLFGYMHGAYNAIKIFKNQKQFSQALETTLKP